jgi:hypothetical protein
MEEICLEIQCIYLNPSLVKATEDSDEEEDSDSVSGLNASEVTSKFHDLKECKHPHLAELHKRGIPVLTLSPANVLITPNVR